MTSIGLRQAERDALAVLGLLASVYEQFDVPVAYSGESAPSHVSGLNIHALVIDNLDGEVLAVERNAIHAEGNPLSHGEQRALRAAIGRVSVKRPRGPAQAIESYYRSSMFLAKGTTAEDFYGSGGTLYTTLEPCPYCASALLVCRMKRVCFVLADKKYGGAWTSLKASYYASDDTTYSALSLDGAGSKFVDSVAVLLQALTTKAEALRKSGVRDTHLLDSCGDELKAAFDMLSATKPTALDSVAVSDTQNVKTLAQLQRVLGMPVQ